MAFRILLATDGTPSARGAARFARLLNEERGADVQVVAVQESPFLIGVDYPQEVASLPPRYVEAAREALRLRVGTQLQEVGGRAGEWPLTIEAGSVAPALAKAGARFGANLFLIGLGTSGTMERWFSRESLVRLTHLCHAPILAVSAELTELPARIVVATDFSEFSTRAARLAVSLGAPGAEIHLAHVKQFPFGATDGAEWDEWERTYRTGVEVRLRELARELESSGDVEVETHLLSGRAGLRLLELAEQLDADMLVTGSHGSGFLGRVVLGGVSAALLHGSRRSILVVPPKSIPPELGLEDLTEEELLRNLGRAGELAFPGPD